MIDERLLKSEEKAIFNLRSLYKKYGYSPYKISKFEEYELYVRNKDFLVSDRVITFNDTNGKLLALKPDVTLSIIKSGEDTEGVKQKVFYNENVYRVSDSTHRFKEIIQTGLECIGKLGLYEIFEVIMLAAESLATVSDDYVIEISHLGIISDILENACSDSRFSEAALKYIAEKNSHDLKRLCENFGIGERWVSLLMTLVSCYGDRRKVIEALSEQYASPYLEELKNLSALLDILPFSDKIRFDFSVVNSMSYYNGFVFKGFLNGICDGVLSGGQYDKMMKKMGRTSGAIGFALYLDLLEQFESAKSGYDADVLILADENVSSLSLAKRVRDLTDMQKSVCVQESIPENFKYGELINLKGDNEGC